ncbi:tRNA pseudouridine(55) synthase TruB [Corynebacterium tapiri]|uniref:tRNA pseudouridine synthase B n=1 Tax=Corynebacterium tapiri TaxID=1448266 RepID=A0A5C4U4R1_9CORY|nr:tRNA pseudouridine(55) synthase TruB [Corynebacterium tapiri]TNL99260.1 tRNA pseudouridine(55) synthase TruB [Corynebacterium tapiri]
MTDPLASSGLVIVDKPAGMTSHDVVGRLRRIMGTRKVGHAGTLDPMATGVLVAGIERGTKFLAHMVAATKSYEAVVRFGSTTTTDDAEGEVLTRADASGLTTQQIHEAADAFRGDIMQRPAAVSALKINGKRAHELVRAGEKVEIPAREVTVFDLQLGELEGTDIPLSVTCSSGFYVRSLARDLGEALGTGAHLVQLRRTAVGPYGLSDARTLEELEHHPALSLSLDEALIRSYPTLECTEQEAADLAMGKWLQPRGLKETHVAVAPDGKAIALVRENGKRLSTVFVARPSTL